MRGSLSMVKKESIWPGVTYRPQQNLMRSTFCNRLGSQPVLLQWRSALSFLAWMFWPQTHENPLYNSLSSLYAWMVPDAFTTRILFLCSSIIERITESLLSIPCFFKWREMHLSSNWIVECFLHWWQAKPKGEKVNRLWTSCWSSAGKGTVGGGTGALGLEIAVGMTDDNEMITGAMTKYAWLGTRCRNSKMARKQITLKSAPK